MARTTFSFHWCSQQGWAFLTAWKHIPVFFSIKLVYKSMTLSESQTYLKYTKLYKKDLHDPDNHDGVIAHLEPDILECEVKWALESITTKLVEVMEFQLSCFKSWKMMLWKCCTQYASKFGKRSSGHRTGKGQFSFQSQRKAMPKNAQLPHN